MSENVADEDVDIITGIVVSQSTGFVTGPPIFKEIESKK
jgi:hypothetical protein